MALNISRTESRLALWSRRLASFCLQLLVASIILHQIGLIDTPTIINLISVSLMGGVAAVIMSVVGLIRIWYQGLAGASWALTAIFLTGLLFAVPAWFMQQLLFLPPINDISTDLQRPPAFERLAGLRPENTSEYPGVETAVEQAEAYPDIVPISLDRSTRSVFDLVSRVIKEMGWQVVSQREPSRSNLSSIIEATDRTLLVGYKDDIVIRITGNDEQSRIDIRSASRYGRHDLGANATRIRGFIEGVKTRLAKVEANRAEQIARKQIEKQKNTKGWRTRSRRRKSRRKLRKRRAAKTSRRSKARKRKTRRRKPRRRKRRRGPNYQYGVDH